MGIRQLLGAEPWGKMAKGKEGLGFGPGLSGCNQGYCGTGMERGLQTVSELFSVLKSHRGKIVRRECGGASEEQRTGKGPGRQGRRRQLLLARESMEQCPRTAKLPLCGVGFS